MATSSQDLRDYSTETKALRRQLREAEAKQRAQQRLANSYLPYIPADASEVTQLASAAAAVSPAAEVSPKALPPAASPQTTGGRVMGIGWEAWKALFPEVAVKVEAEAAAKSVTPESLFVSSLEAAKDVAPESLFVTSLESGSGAASSAEGPASKAPPPVATWVQPKPPQESEDAVVSRHSSSEVTQLAVPDGAAVQPTTSPRSLGMQCPECDGFICSGEQLAFFARRNAAQGFEVHLMLKPELEPDDANLHLMPEVAANALASWQCACGHKLGDTRKVGPRKTPMTAFKSSSVKLFGRHYTNKKSQWPTIYTDAPFNVIEVRQWGEFHGQRR